MLTAAILAIGDELVTGLTTDTNSGFLSQSLRSLGVEVVGYFTVPDDEDAILRALGRAAEDATFIITTGGLGPTADDLTTACVARFAGTPLDLHLGSLMEIEGRFRSRGLEMPPNNRKQALLPRGGTLIPNPDGTAPGFIVEIPDEAGSRFVASFPGVPREMRRMVDETLLPWIAGRVGRVEFDSRTFSIFGITESRIDELLEGAIDPRRARLSFRAAFPRLQVRVSVSASTRAEVSQELDELENIILERLGDVVYSLGDVGLEQSVGELLLDRRLTLGVAESCTGGLIGHRITDVPGSSEYFKLGVVAYSNSMKQQLLGVRDESLAEYGAVSEQVVAEMAEGVRAAAQADIGVATSGIAGPGGGTEAKPVGTVCIGIASPRGIHTSTHALGSRSRSWIKEMTAQLAMDHLRRELLKW